VLCIESSERAQWQTFKEDLLGFHNLFVVSKTKSLHSSAIREAAILPLIEKTRSCAQGDALEEPSPGVITVNIDSFIPERRSALFRRHGSEFFEAGMYWYTNS
jgi:hypothetical protein